MKKALIILSVIIVSCNADDAHRTFQPISGEAKYYMDFDPGSYWVYEDSISGNIDSVVLLSKKLELEHSGDDDFTGHSLIYVFYSSHFDMVYTAGLWYTYDSTTTIFTRGFDDYELFSMKDIYYNWYYDTLTVKGKAYYRVHAIMKKTHRAYVAKNIGLVKLYKNYHYDKEQCWELIRYDVVRN